MSNTYGYARKRNDRAFEKKQLRRQWLIEDCPLYAMMMQDVVEEEA